MNACHEGNEHELVLAKARRRLNEQTTLHCKTWGLHICDWMINQDDGVILFTQKCGKVWKSQFQIIGSFSQADHTWIWGWNHPSVDRSLAQAANKVLEYGMSRDISELIENKVSCSENDCWDFTALACYLFEHSGAYKADLGDTLVFVTFADLIAVYR